MPFTSSQKTNFADKFGYKAPVNGEDIYQKILRLIESDDSLSNVMQEGDNPAKKNKLFKHFLHEISHELAAATYTSGVSEHTTIDRLSFNDLATAFLQKKGYKDQADIASLSTDEKLNLYREFTAKIKTIHPRILEQTPHPTEPLSTEAINSYTALRNFARDETRPLFENPNLDLAKTNIPVEQLKEKIREFYDNLEPPATGLSAENEQARSAVLSKNIYDSVPILASNLIKTRDFFGLQSVANDKEKDALKTRMRDAALDASAYMIRNYTWSPMDMDGKLQMDRRRAEEGLRGKKLAINQQYIEDLANLAISLRAKGGNDEAVERIQALVWKLFGNIEKIYPTVTDDVDNLPLEEQVYFDKINNFIKSVGSRNSEETKEFIQEVWNKRDQEESRKELNIIKYAKRTLSLLEKTSPPREASLKSLKNTIRNAESSIKRLHRETFVDNYMQGPEGIISADSILKELKEIANISKVRDVKYQSTVHTEYALSEIDAVALKVATYQNSAQKITWRQSAEVHEEVMEEVLNFIQNRESVLNPGGKLKPAPDFMKKINKLIASGALPEVQKKAGELLDVCDLIHIMKSTDKHVIEVATEIRKTIREQVRANRDAAYQKKDAIAYMETTAQQEAYFEKHRKEIYTYETLDVVDFVNQKGEDFGHILTAETNGPEALWSVFAEQLVMQNPNKIPTAKETSKQPQIIALTEYLDDIVNLPENISKAMAFQPFRDEMEARSENSPPWLQVWNEEKKHLTPMTVSDLLTQIEMGQSDTEIAKQTKDEMIDIIKRRIALKTRDKNADLGPEALKTVTEDEIGNVTPEQLTEALNQNVLSYVAMVAGSDSFKSAGAAIEYTIDRRFADSQKQLMAYDTLLNFYMGNGSAMHRVGITNALIRTHQGRQMKEGAETLAAESMNVIGKRLANKFDLPVTIGNPQTPTEKFIVGIHNIGNRCNMETAMSSEDHNRYDSLCYESEAFYSSIYKDYGEGDHRPAVITEAKERIKHKLPKNISPEDFGNYMKDITLSKLDAVSKNGARYGFRPGKADAFVDSMRAIGYGAAHGYTGFGQPHLTFALSHMLGADENGGIDAAKTFKSFIENPYLQGRINRAAKDLAVEFSPETGWKNVASGCGVENLSYHYDSSSKKPVAISIGKQNFTIEELVKGDDKTTKRLASAVENNRDSKSKKVENKKEDKNLSTDRVVKNIRMAAVMETEGRKAIGATTKLFEEFKRQANLKNSKISGRADDAETLLQHYREVSPTKGAEMAFLREQYQQSLSHASESFKTFNSLQGKLPKKTGEKETEAYKAYRNSYYDIALMKTVLETPLTSDKSPAYAIDIASNLLPKGISR